MNIYTDEQIKAKCLQVWNAEHERECMIGWERDGSGIEVVENDPNRIQIKIECMYGAPTFNLPLLMELAEFFGTKNINDDDSFALSGCETCDYGSSYGFTLTIRPEATEVKP